MPGGPIQETAAVTVGTDVWVIGGLTSFVEYSDDVWIFDTVGRTWRAGPTLPAAMHHANAAVVDGSVYIVGYLAGGFAASGAVYRFTPGVDTEWNARAAMPAGTERGASVTGVIGGDIYVAGGLRGGAAVANFSSYSPDDNLWRDLVPLPMARDHACGGVIFDALIVAGGRQGDIGSTTSSVVSFDPAGIGVWATRGDLPTGRGGTACGVIADRLIIVGGEGNPDAPSGVFPQNEAFDAATDGWETLEPMRTPRHGMAAAVVGGVLYVPGGATQQAIGAVDTHETFTP